MFNRLFALLISLLLTYMGANYGTEPIDTPAAAREKTGVTQSDDSVNADEETEDEETDSDASDEAMMRFRAGSASSKRTR